jgi:glycosyltransferase involved in cell wall biosynthesis
MVGSRGIPAQSGGVEKVLEAVCPRLASVGNKVRVYGASWAKPAERQWRGVELTPVPGVRHKYLDTISRSFIATVRDIFGPSKIVHYHACGSAPLALLPRLFGKKVVVTVHGLDSQRKKWNAFGAWYLRLGEWASCRFPHTTVVVSQQLKRVLDQRYEIDTVYIPNGVENKPARPADKIRAFGLETGKYLLFLARLVPEKGCDVLLDAFLSLKEHHGYKLVIAGPTWHSEEYTASLKKKAEGHADIVFTGEVGTELVEELYSHCRAFVLPSEIEGMSLSLLDAMAFGCCIISSDIPENTDVVRDVAITFRTGDVEDLAKRIELVMSDSTAVNEFKAKSKARVTDEFLWDTVVKRWMKMYDSLDGS